LIGHAKWPARGMKTADDTPVRAGLADNESTSKPLNYLI
jgi:hypothetical protein